MLVFSHLKPYCLLPCRDGRLPPTRPRRRLTALSRLRSLLTSFCVQELGSEFDVLLDGLFDWVVFYCLPSYSLFRFLLLLDAAVQCREEKKAGSDGGFGNGGAPLGGHAISDSAAEGMLMCLEELLKKCHLGSVNQAAELEALRGHRGSANLRKEAFLTLRVLVAKAVGELQRHHKRKHLLCQIRQKCLVHMSALRFL
ncbi:TELO2 interacting protein 1 [Musa troglodytarum]|uniref:TELO2 interacting protein 1 n=1 Tax=Musa troglodytarum TaxID=320322 RepID=A0A9E7KCS8_9LILI|nr:TELO2 interacting protein 1 [Musa troglodytarum]